MNSHFSQLEQEALLHISGPDSLTFLQGQTSCDTRNVDLNHAQPGVFCTPQGRVVCDFMLCQLGAEHFALRLRRDIRLVSSQTFGKYIIFSKASLDDNREDWLPAAVWGPEASSAVQALFGTAPGKRFDATTGEGFVVIQADEQGQQFECFLQEAAASQYLDRMAQEMTRGMEAEWQALQITDGLARIELATMEEHVPQTLNYDVTGHISFNKGCYTGQEVVARLHYLGKPKRRAYPADLPAGAECCAGTPLFDARTGNNVGSIVNAVATTTGVSALVEATADGIANGLLLGAADGTPLAIRALPYSLEGS